MPIMRRKLVTLVGIIIVNAFTFGIGPAKATVITSGCASINVSCTLEELAGGGDIVIDDKRFGNWSVIDTSTLPVDTGAIQVLALDDQPLNPGLQYNTSDGFSVTGLDLIDLFIEFSVSTIDGTARIKDNSLEIGDFAFGSGNFGGFITIFEDVRDASGSLIGDKLVMADNLPPPLFDLFDSATFSPQATIDVETWILAGGDDPNDSVSLTSFTQRFSQIPEPATLLLVGVGLAGFGIARKKR